MIEYDFYPVELGIGVGRRGRTETWIEFRTGLMRQDQAALLWLVFSADALRPGGTLEEMLDRSKRFAADLAIRLRERIYDRVVPGLATGIAKARGLKVYNPRAGSESSTLVGFFQLHHLARALRDQVLAFVARDAIGKRDEVALRTALLHWCERWPLIANCRLRRVNAHVFRLGRVFVDRH